MNFRSIRYVLSRIMLAEAAFMVLPLIVCFIYIPWDNDPMKAVWAFVISIAALVVCGVLFGIKAPRDGEIFARDGLAIVSLSWIVMSLFGALPFTISGATATYVDSVFETVSGFTTTGASILTGDVIESLGHGILFWRSFTHLMGGMGVLVFVMAILPMSGARNMHIMRAEVPGPEVGKLVSKIGKTAKILYAIYLVITLIETVVLMICGMEPFDALIHSFGTAGTGGFSNRAASIGYYANPAIHVSISIFMLIFGVNFNIYYLVLLKQFKKAFDNLELKVYFAIVGVSTAIVTANIIRQIGSFGESLKLSFFQVSSLITTTGYATYDFNTWPNLSKAIVILLMFFGATAGSTGGGFKLSRIIILVKSAIREMKKLIHPHAVSPVRMDKKSVDEATVHGTFVYFVVYASVLLVSFFLLSIDPVSEDPTTSFTAVLSCLNNIGPGLNKVGPAENFAFFSIPSKILLTVDMLLGRLEIFPVLMLFAPGMWKRRRAMSKARLAKIYAEDDKRLGE